MSDEPVVMGETTLATMDHAPEAVLAEAQKAAVALQDVIKRKKKPVMMGDEQYLEFEDWQTLGRFYEVTAGEECEAEFVELPGGVKGFKATAVALIRGQAVSRATAYCLNDEEKWSTRPRYEYHMALKAGGTAREEDSEQSAWIWEDNPNKPGGKRPKRVRVAAGEERVPLYQLASMAQTRANAKVLRNVLSWVAVLAGYKPTPAEEMDGVKAEEKPAEKPKTEKPKDREPGEDDGPPSATDMTCRFCDSPEVTVSASGKTAKCEQCGKGWNTER